jgi:hypothetical protein
MPTDSILLSWGLTYGQAQVLAQMNDGVEAYEGDPRTFGEIAVWIRENVHPTPE